MAPLDGTILTKMNIKHPQMPDNNISKAQPSKAKGLGGVRFPRSKTAPALYIYKVAAFFDLCSPTAPRPLDLEG